MSTKQFMLSNLTDLSNSAVQPSIAMSGNNVVAIYRQSGSTGTALYYQAGTISNSGALSLGSKIGVPQKGNTGSTDNGETPTIAINNQGLVIEMHESNGPSSELWTHIGQQNGTAITWGDSQDSGHSGDTPSVGLAYMNSHHVAVSVFESSGTIYCMIGTINSSSKTVSWSKLGTHFSGYNPRVAINNQRDVVVVFDNGSSTVYSLVGQLNSSLDDISWASSAHSFDSAARGYAAVGLSDDGLVVTAYQGATYSPNSSVIDSYTIRTQAGALDSSSKSIAWTPGFEAGFGKKPSITTNGSVVLLLQESPDSTIIANNGYASTSNASKVNFATSTVQSIHLGRQAWMSHYQNKTLKQLALPAAHDAGMSTTGYCTNLASVHPDADTKTQSKNFKDMLDCGIRYFDVRPVWFKNLNGSVDSYTGHFAPDQGGIGCLGLSMSSVFSEILSFLAEGNNKEVIILKFSHYYEQVEVNNGIDNTIVDDGTHDDIFNPLKKDLIEYLVQTFDLPNGGSWLYRKPTSESRRLVDIPLSSITGGQAKIIAVFDDVDIDGLFSTAGITDQNTLALYNDAKALTYYYKDYYQNGATPPTVSNYDFVVYDRYTNTDQLSTMVSATTPSDASHPGQVYQYLQSANHNADLYLLSWTLTQQLADQIAGSPSIQTLAGQANSCLGQNLQTLIQQGHVTSSYLPNLVYVDFCDNFVTDACVFINAMLYNE